MTKEAEKLENIKNKIVKLVSFKRKDFSTKIAIWIGVDISLRFQATTSPKNQLSKRPFLKPMTLDVSSIIIMLFRLPKLNGLMPMIRPCLSQNSIRV